jgi:hypothetical protein
MNRLEKKSGKQIHSQWPKKIEYLINLTKEVKDLYNQNYKILKKKTEENRKKKRPLMFMD